MSKYYRVVRRPGWRYWELQQQTGIGYRTLPMLFANRKEAEDEIVNQILLDDDKGEKGEWINGSTN